MNLRLEPELAAALRAEAESSGYSQQEILRAAVRRHLERAATNNPRGNGGDEAALTEAGAIRPPRVPYRKAVATVVLPDGVSSLELLDRDDRL